MSPAGCLILAWDREPPGQSSTWRILLRFTEAGTGGCGEVDRVARLIARKPSPKPEIVRRVTGVLAPHPGLRACSFRIAVHEPCATAWAWSEGPVRCPQAGAVHFPQVTHGVRGAAPALCTPPLWRAKWAAYLGCSDQPPPPGACDGGVSLSAAAPARCSRMPWMSASTFSWSRTYTFSPSRCSVQLLSDFCTSS